MGMEIAYTATVYRLRSEPFAGEWLIEHADSIAIIETLCDLHQSRDRSGSTPYAAHFAMNADGTCNNRCSWHEHEAHLCEFTKDFVDDDVVIELLVEYGDDSAPDRKYFRAGQILRCPGKVVFPPFDPSGFAQLK